jgi:hypothetical protein
VSQDRSLVDRRQVNDNHVAGRRSASSKAGFVVSSPSSVNRELPLAGNFSSPSAGSPSRLDLEIPPMVRLAQAAFLRDLPNLIAEHRRSWAAYHGDQRVAIGASKRQLFKECAARKIPPGEFIVRLIEPEIPEDIDWNESRDV